MTHIACTLIVCAAALGAWALWLKTHKQEEAWSSITAESVKLVANTIHDCFCVWLEKQPVCTLEDFTKLTKQVNILTESMTIVQQANDSLRTAVGMSRMRSGNGA